MGLVFDKQPASRLGTVQQITTDAASVAVTNPFGAQTYQVRIAITANGCFFRVGDGTPTATASDSFLPIQTIDYITVTPGQKLAAIQNAAAGTLTVTEMN